MYILLQLSSFSENVSDSIKELFYGLGPSVRDHPANKIMHYAKKQETHGELPNILGLTISPVIRKKGEGLQ